MYDCVIYEFAWVGTLQMPAGSSPAGHLHSMMSNIVSHLGICNAYSRQVPLHAICTLSKHSHFAVSYLEASFMILHHQLSFISMQPNHRGYSHVHRHIAVLLLCMVKGYSNIFSELMIRADIACCGPKL